MVMRILAPVPVRWTDLAPAIPQETPQPGLPDPDRLADQLLEEARQEAARLLQQAQTEAAALVAQAETESKQQAAQALVEARQHGRRQALEEVAAERTQLLQEAHGVLQQARQKRQELAEGVVQELTDLALAIARAVVGRELASAPEEVVDLARRLMAAHSGTTVIWAHPDEVGLLEGWLSTSGQEVEVRPDAGVGPHGIVMEGADGVLDASLASRWRQAASIVGERPRIPARGDT
jgi:flagellar assembly protein FliH